MSLFIIGGVRCELAPFNVEGVEDESEMPFARHEILGGALRHEKTAEIERTLTMKGKIFPRAIGGEKELALLESLQADGSPVLVTRGQSNLGWYVITRLRRSHSHLDGKGVGRMVEIRIDLERAVAPGAASAAGILTRLFGYA